MSLGRRLASTKPLAKTLMSLAIAMPLAMGFAASAAQAQPNAGVERMSAIEQPIAIEINKGALVRLKRPAASVFITEPDVADVRVQSPTLVYVYGKGVGETTLYAIDGRERVIVSSRVKVNHDLSAARAAIRDLDPDGKVRLASIDGALVLRGEVEDGEQAENIRRVAARFVGPKEEVINRLQVRAPMQVNLRVRVAEISRTLTKRFGINWDGVLSGTDAVIGIATGNPATIGGQFLTRVDGANNIFGSVSKGALDLNGVIDALSEEGVLTILAEPNLTARTGETASFLAGGEFPIPVPQDQDTILIEYKQFGVSLAFTPTVLSGGRIALRVNPEVSELSRTDGVEISGFNIPALTTRRADTTVELGSGQSFAIAGLIQSTSNHTISSLPGLGDLPILGPLFRSDRFLRGESELVIIVTPYLVRPVSDHRMATPIDGFYPPNDLERIMFGRNYGYRAAAAVARRQGADSTGLAGPVGFMLD